MSVPLSRRGLERGGRPSGRRFGQEFLAAAIAYPRNVVSLREFFSVPISNPPVPVIKNKE